MSGICPAAWGYCKTRSKSEGGVKPHKCGSWMKAPGDHSHECRHCGAVYRR